MDASCASVYTGLFTVGAGFVTVESYGIGTGSLPAIFSLGH